MSIVYIRLAVPPALIAAAATRAPPQSMLRDPWLETLLARADAVQESHSWRVGALRVLGLGDVPPAAGLVQALRVGAVPEPWVMLATPVHMSAGHSHVQLASHGVLRLSHPEARTLADDFNGIFAGDAWRMAATANGGDNGCGAGSQLLCCCERQFDVLTCDPMEARGSDVWEFQPRGADALQLRRLMSEMELWLFEHPVNRERVARGGLPVTGLWLWAGAASLTSVPPVQGFSSGADPILAAAGTQAEWPRPPTSGVVVLDAVPGAADWTDAVDRWLRPALEALRTGSIAALRLSLGRRCFSVRSGAWHRFWRRPRAWWEYFEHE